MTLTHRLLFDLRKAQQLGLFGAAPPPTAKPREREEPSRAAAPPPTPSAKPPAPASPASEHPPGAGWTPIPGSRHGGYHRQKPGGGFEYWYPGEGMRETARDLGDTFELKPQAAGKPKDKSGRQVHHDVGEKVGGARKDKYATVHAGNLGALATEAALVDARVQQQGARLETLRARLLHQAEDATSPLERERLRRQAYEVEEAAGALRYSAVTGTDDSDL